VPDAAPIQRLPDSGLRRQPTDEPPRELGQRLKAQSQALIERPPRPGTDREGLPDNPRPRRRPPQRSRHLRRRRSRRHYREYPQGPRPASNRRTPAELEELTEREREVLALIAAGLNNREIAERLIISPATAKTHVSRILLKLEARDRAQLVVIAYQSGLIKTRPVTS
jgi:DNA-binding CsgD family transcriptional regulator